MMTPPVVRTITAFGIKGVIPRAKPPDRTEHFVRDRDAIYAEVSTAIATARLTRFHRRSTAADLASTAKWAHRLARELDGPAPALRILGVARWYEEHCTDRFVPWVQGGPSLYQKFSRLEAIMIEHRRDEAPSGVDAVLSGLFNGSRVVAEAFISDVLAPARRIDFGGVDDASLAAALGGLYRAVTTARSGADTDLDLTSQFGGPLDILRQYVGWLADKDWRSTVRVLGLDSPAFRQFRRELASTHPYGADPLTGKVR